MSDLGDDRVSVSVIIASYNLAEYLPAALDSAIGQTCRPTEIIVVDDGSTDDSVAVASRYGPPVRVLSQENRGAAAARNRAIDEAAGEWLAFLDADDVWHPTYLERQLAAVDGPDVVCAFSDFYLFGEGRERSDRQSPDHACQPDFRVAMLCEYSALVSMSVVRAQALEGLRFPEGITDSEDMIFFLELRERGSFVHTREPLVGYRIRPTSAVRRAGHELRSVATRYEYLRRHRERYSRADSEAVRRRLAEALIPSHGRALWKDRDLAMVRAYRRLFDEVRPESLPVPPAFRHRLYPRWMYRIRDAIASVTGV